MNKCCEDRKSEKWLKTASLGNKEVVEKNGKGCLFVGENYEHPQANFRQQVGTQRRCAALWASCLALTKMWKMTWPCLHYLWPPKDSDVCFSQGHFILRIAVFFSMSFWRLWNNFGCNSNSKYWLTLDLWSLIQNITHLLAQMLTNWYIAEGMTWVLFEDVEIFGNVISPCLRPHCSSGYNWDTVWLV